MSSGNSSEETIKTEMKDGGGSARKDGVNVESSPEATTAYQSNGDDGSSDGSDKRRPTKQQLVIGAIAAAMILIIIALLMPCDHEWAKATCTEPETCEKCGETEGEPLGHKWIEATCTEPRTCLRCGVTEGDPIAHTWEDPTCTEPRVCLVCGETRGPSLGHSVSEWIVDKEASCTEAGSQHGVCDRCGETVTESIPLVDHTEGEWEVTENFTVTSSGTVIPGERSLTCSVCGEVLRTEEYTIELTVSQRNALRSADSYLSFMAFSHDGLIDQLEYEGYSTEDATFAADNCGADWYEQAALSAESYLEFMAFSRSGLIRQLEYEGFTRDQAEYGATSVGL